MHEPFQGLKLNLQAVMIHIRSHHMNILTVLDYILYLNSCLDLFLRNVHLMRGEADRDMS